MVKYIPFLVFLFLVSCSHKTTNRHISAAVTPQKTAGSISKNSYNCVPIPDSDEKECTVSRVFKTSKAVQVVYYFGFPMDKACWQFQCMGGLNMEQLDIDECAEGCRVSE